MFRTYILPSGFRKKDVTSSVDTGKAASGATCHDVIRLAGKSQGLKQSVLANHNPVAYQLCLKTNHHHLASSPLSCCVLPVPLYLVISLLCSVVNMSAPPAKVRRPNFTRAEMFCIIHEVKQRRALLLGNLNNYAAGITNERRERAWEAIVSTVNAISHITRTPEEIRSKFRDMRAQCKMKISKNVRYMEGTVPCEGTYSA